jgi:hypothetical protein
MSYEVSLTTDAERDLEVAVTWGRCWHADYWALDGPQPVDRVCGTSTEAPAWV